MTGVTEPATAVADGGAAIVNVDDPEYEPFMFAALSANATLLTDLCSLMTDASLCAMGGLTPVPVTSAFRHFPEDFTGRTVQSAAQ